jgi:hypothetical protein
MRILILMIATLVVVINTSLTIGRQSEISNHTAQPSQRLEVQLFTEKHIYKKGDKLNLKVMISNNSDQDIFVYGNLEWGYLASLTLCLRDGRGKDIQPKFISDAITYPPNDKSQFVKLSPFHFLGTYYVASTEDLNMQRPGRYSIFVEYHSPILSAKAGVSPFYGKESGMIRSKPIWIEVQ